MKQIEFIREGLRNLKTVGSIAKSSKYLCKNMADRVDYKKAKLIVELGAGDGVITHHILRNMEPDSKLLVFEVNELFCEELRNISDPRLIIAEDSAEKLGEYLKQIGAENVDYFISAIPFVALPKELGLSIVKLCYQYLRLGGSFIQVHYSLLAKSLYESVFGNVDVNFVPFNMPPAFVLVSEKRAASLSSEVIK